MSILYRPFNDGVGYCGKAKNCISTQGKNERAYNQRRWIGVFDVEDPGKAMLNLYHPGL